MVENGKIPVSALVSPEIFEEKHKKGVLWAKLIELGLRYGDIFYQKEVLEKAIDEKESFIARINKARDICTVNLHSEQDKSVKLESEIKDHKIEISRLAEDNKRLGLEIYNLKQKLAAVEK